jgi:hypothetical protein
MSGANLYSPNTPSWRGAQLKHRDNFTFNLPLSHPQHLCSIKNVTHILLSYSILKEQFGFRFYNQ